MATDNGAGVFEVGTNDAHEVVINLPRDMTGHIVFSPQQARALADTLTRKAVDAEQAHRDELTAKQRENAPPVDRTKQCTTSGDSPDAVRAKQREEGNKGQHSSYIVLCEEERKKGFVRPYRDAYKHVGRLESIINDGDYGNDKTVEHRIGGCGTVTTMGRALSETYARDPTFYSATFCVNCNKHLPVAEFVWTADGQQVGQ